MTHLSELFYNNLVIGGSALLLALGALFYRSKCDKVNVCFGCIQIHRNIEKEVENDEHIEMPQTSLDLESCRQGAL